MEQKWKKDSNHLICFDLDGVLIHSMTLANQIFFDTVEEMLHLPTEAFRHDKKLMALTAEERFELLWKQEIKDQSIAQKDIEKTLKLYRERKLAADIPLLPHAKEAVELMAKYFEFLAVVSNNPKSLIESTLIHLNIRPYFSSLFGIDHLKFTKPHPEIYQTAANHFGLDPKNCLAFEDSTHGIASAKGAGMKVIGVATGLESVEELQKTPADEVWRNFSGVSIEMVNDLLS